MIEIFSDEKIKRVAELVAAAFSRSFGQQQTRISEWKTGSEKISTDCIVFINPSDNVAADIIKFLETGRKKIIIFGSLPHSLMDKLGIRSKNWPENFEVAARSAPAREHEFSESSAKVVYCRKSYLLDGLEWIRPLERFDFRSEWNNLGFGAIRALDPIWGLACCVTLSSDHELANVSVNDAHISSYAGLFDLNGGSVLWFNRAIGPIDSHEWCLVENFISTYRANLLACLPFFLEIPWGYDAAVTMRLDCDEDVESARVLFEEYQTMQVPFSLAVCSSNLAEPKNIPLVREVACEGGSILSHSATHPASWGGEVSAAKKEALDSSLALEVIIQDRVKFLVSPFHQTPEFALEVLFQSGFHGCVGGLISDRPECVIARGGSLCYPSNDFVFHTQQCMLHGDCMLSIGDPLRIYKLAFDLAYSSNSFFAYLDHPFSDRYAYGWLSEGHRVEAHKSIISYIRTRAKNPFFASENDALNFLKDKSRAEISLEGQRIILNGEPPRRPLKISFRGGYFRAGREEWDAGGINL
jgi:hypothetical protein